MQELFLGKEKVSLLKPSWEGVVMKEIARKIKV